MKFVFKNGQILYAKPINPMVQIYKQIQLRNPEFKKIHGKKKFLMNPANLESSMNPEGKRFMMNPAIDIPVFTQWIEAYQSCWEEKNPFSYWHPREDICFPPLTFWFGKEGRKEK